MERKRAVLPVEYAAKNSKRAVVPVNKEINAHIRALEIKVENQVKAIKYMQKDMNSHGVAIVIDDSDEEWSSIFNSSYTSTKVYVKYFMK